MTTFGQMIHLLRQRLTGYGANKAGIAALTEALDAGSTTFKVDDVTGWQKGIAQIGLETIRIKSVDPATSRVQLYPFGRGYMGTTATEHAEGTEVLFQDSWPTLDVARALNASISALYPTLYAVAEVTGTPNERGRLTLPAGATGVVSVWARVADTDPWVEQRTWTFNPELAEIVVAVGVNATVRVMYAKRPTVFTLDEAGLDADFETTTGLGEHLVELVLLGATASLAPYVDISRLPYTTTAVREQGNDVQPPTGGQAVARYLVALYQQRLAEEAVALHREHPIKTNRTVR